MCVLTYYIDLHCRLSVCYLIPYHLVCLIMVTGMTLALQSHCVWGGGGGGGGGGGRGEHVCVQVWCFIYGVCAPSITFSAQATMTSQLCLMKFLAILQTALVTQRAAM